MGSLFAYVQQVSVSTVPFLHSNHSFVSSSLALFSRPLQRRYVSSTSLLFNLFRFSAQIKRLSLCLRHKYTCTYGGVEVWIHLGFFLILTQRGMTDERLRTSDLPPLVRRLHGAQFQSGHYEECKMGFP
jgi:hypothetical protein